MRPIRASWGPTLPSTRLAWSPQLSPPRRSAPLKLGVGLPSVIPARDPELVVEWARRADQLPFSSLGAHDRLAWDGYEAMVALSAAAGATRRVRLAALAVIAPLRNPALLAKQSSS